MSAIAGTRPRAECVRIVLQERSGSAPLEPPRRAALLRALLEKGYRVSAVQGPLVVDGEPGVREIVLLRESEDESERCGERPMDLGPRGPRLHVREIAGLSGEGVVAAVEKVLRRGVGPDGPRSWYPWFPVVDYSRCTHCMQCLSFCLFDVYGVDEAKRLVVQNPENCKTNCPACSRVCPEVAIVFPKYGAGPINGAEVRQEDVEREKMKTDISALLGGDIYAMLRERHRRAESRFSKERDAEKALKERMRCLKKVQGLLDEVPPEVLMALPSAAEIQARAAQAHERAQEALRARGRPEGGGATGRGAAER